MKHRRWRGVTRPRLPNEKLQTKRGTKRWFYRSYRWRETRRKFISTTDGLCEICRLYLYPMEVNHIDPLTNFDYANQTNKCYDFKNLQLLCKPCHDKIHNRGEKDIIDSKYYFDENGNVKKK